MSICVLFLVHREWVTCHYNILLTKVEIDQTKGRKFKKIEDVETKEAFANGFP